MSIVLDHTIVPAHDNEASAGFFARIFGLRYEGSMSHFAPVRVNDTLVMDFDTCATFERHHYAFKVSEPEFDGIFERVKGEGLAYGSGPRSRWCIRRPASATRSARSRLPGSTAPRW